MGFLPIKVLSCWWQKTEKEQSSLRLGDKLNSKKEMSLAALVSFPILLFFLAPTAWGKDAFG